MDDHEGQQNDAGDGQVQLATADRVVAVDVPRTWVLKSLNIKTWGYDPPCAADEWNLFVVWKGAFSFAKDSSNDRHRVL